MKNMIVNNETMEIMKFNNENEMYNLNLDDMIESSGGGFAYDVGRALRLLFLAGSPTTAPSGVSQWVNEGIVNDAYQKTND